MLHLVRVYLNTCAAVLGALFLVLAPVAASADTLAAAANLIMTAAAMALVAVICRLCAVLFERI